MYTDNYTVQSVSLLWLALMVDPASKSITCDVTLTMSLSDLQG